MASSYFVESRLRGYAESYAEGASARTVRVAKKLKVEALGGHRFVSHITSLGPARTDNLVRVIDEFERVGLKYTLVPLKLGGFSGFQINRPNWDMR